MERQIDFQPLFVVGEQVAVKYEAHSPQMCGCVVHKRQKTKI